MSEDVAFDNPKNYAIHACGITLPAVHKLQRLVWPNGYRHFFLQLTNAGQPLSELHFAPKDHHGATQEGLPPFKLLSTLFNTSRREDVYRRLVDSIGLHDRQIFLRAVTKAPVVRADGRDPVDFGAVAGTPTDILSAWNQACRIGVAINRADIFYTNAFDGSAGDCHAGTTAVLNKLGPSFAGLAAALTPCSGRDLRKEARLDEMVPLQTAGVSIETLLATQNDLKAALACSAGKPARVVMRDAALNSLQTPTL